MSPDESADRGGGADERQDDGRHGARAGDPGESSTAPDQRTSASAGGAGVGEKYCSNCGSLIDATAEFCPSCGGRQPGAGTSDEKDPAVAALASFVIVGAGQVYNGQIGRGIALHLSMWVAAVVGLLFFWLLLPVLLPLVVWGFAVYDAYDQAEKINLGEVSV